MVEHAGRKTVKTRRTVPLEERSEPLNVFADVHPRAARMYARRFRSPSDPDATTLADDPDQVVLVEFRPTH